MICRLLIACLLLSPAATVRGQQGSGSPEEETVDFGRDIRPIFANRCVKCHGPDEPDRHADLRLDVGEGLGRVTDSGRAIVQPGASAQSELYHRITATDPDRRMPPPDFGEALSQQETQLIRRWIEQRAPWQSHWSYIRPQRAKLPGGSNATGAFRNEADWAARAADLFTLQRLIEAGLEPAEPAAPDRLLRRATLDMAGRPPTIGELDRFLADDSPDAYHRVVDRLLSSPEFGETAALRWLDLARYADTHGYHIDSHRDMWRWRDWVIDGLNRGMSFDRFTIEQLAGDLIPQATLEQRIASGFNRNNMVNFEGGAIDEEYRNEYVVDRVVTTSTVWLGQTMRCARCHDHKYDPLTQLDFYQLAAYFNNVAEKGLDGKKGNAAPVIKAPTDVQQYQLDQLAFRLEKLRSQLAKRRSVAAATQQQWELQLREGAMSLAQPPADMIAHFKLDEARDNRLVDEISGRLFAANAPPRFLPGKLDKSLQFDGSLHVDCPDVAGFERDQAFACGAWIYSTSEEASTVVSRMDDDQAFRGFDLYLQDGTVFVHVINNWSDNAIRVRTKQKVENWSWQHVMMTYDGSSSGAGVAIYVNGQLQPVEITHDSLTESIRTDAPFRIGQRSRVAAFRGMIDDVQVFDRQLKPAEVALIAGARPIEKLLAIPLAQRSEDDQQRLLEYYLQHHDEPTRVLTGQLEVATQRRKQITAQIPTTMVMQENASPRNTYILGRGDYRNRQEQVEPGIPAILGDPATRPVEHDLADRLGLARWLVSPENPLTARVTVNRIWESLFDRGLVKTSEDFGTRGAWPSHPRLLDWLAVEFIDSGWDLKRMHRLILTSNTYRQSARAAAADYRRDPDNALLARGPRSRLPAEHLRDTALFMAGMLNRRIGGPSVYPYQPPGLWKEVSFNPRDFTAQVYTPSHGADLYRKGLYTFRKRAVPPPSLEAFGTPDRETCVVRRSRSNTPLQVLVQMNDPTYVEASRKFAERVIKSHESLDQRIRFAYRAALTRPPQEAERELIKRLLSQQRAAFAADKVAASSLLEVGESSFDERLDRVELAAWTTIASLIMTLDEAISN